MRLASRDAAAVVAFFGIALWMWLAMMLTHELGHVLAARATGGEIVSVELRPGRLAHTFVRPNPAPSVVLWGGFAFGWLVPQATAPAWAIRRGLIGPVLLAWAAVCLLAGGSYLAVGGGERLTDTGQLVLAGWPLPLLVAAGLAVAVLGYVRSRAAWTAIAREVGERPLGWRAACGWWALVAAWWLGQSGLHAMLQPDSNVR